MTKPLAFDEAARMLRALINKSARCIKAGPSLARSVSSMSDLASQGSDSGDVSSVPILRRRHIAPEDAVAATGASSVPLRRQSSDVSGSSASHPGHTPSLTPSSRSTSPASDASHISHAHTPLPLEVFDVSDMMQLPPQVAVTLLGRVDGYLEEMVGKMRDSAAAGDWNGVLQGVKILAHSVKGAALQSRARRLAAASKELERLAPGGPSTATSDALATWYAVAAETLHVLRTTSHQTLLEGPVLSKMPLAELAATAGAPTATMSNEALLQHDKSL